MKFKIDENLPKEAAQLLASAGHDALTVLDQELGGQPDQQISAVCKSESRALITNDKDFCDVRTYPPKDFVGIVVLRLGRQDKRFALDIISRLIPAFQTEPLERRLWIVDEHRIRIRK